MDEVKELKAQAYDTIAEIELHANKIQELKQKLYEINEQIKQYGKDIQSSAT